MSENNPNPQPPNKSLPPRVRAGDLLTWSVRTQLTVGAQLFYVLTAVINNAPVRIQIAPVNVDSTGTAAFSMASTVTTAWQPGRYQWVCFSVDSSGNRDQLAQGKIIVQPDPAGAVPADPRTDDEKLLGQIKALLKGKALDDAAMYKIGERELTKMPVRDLIYWEGIVEARVKRARRGRGEFVPSNTIGITFGGR